MARTKKRLDLLPQIEWPGMPPLWRLYLEDMQPLLGNANGLDWQVIDKSNARLDELGIRPHSALQDIQGSGDLHVSQSDVDRWDNLGGSNVLTWLIGG